MNKTLAKKISGFIIGPVIKVAANARSVTYGFYTTQYERPMGECLVGSYKDAMSRRRRYRDEIEESLMNGEEHVQWMIEAYQKHVEEKKVY